VDLPPLTPLLCGVFLPLPLSQAFPFLITKQCFAPASCSVCLQFTWEVGLPPSPMEFSSLYHSNNLFRSWLLGACPPLPPKPLRPTQLVYLQFREGFPSPSLRCSVCPTLFPLCIYCSYCLLPSFSFFPGGGQSVQGAMLLWPRVVCGSTVYREAHLVHVFLSHLGVGVWRPRGPPCFSV
jgi:hypothetical protein